MKYSFNKITVLFFLISLFFIVACDDSDKYVGPPSVVNPPGTENEVAALYICSEGLFSMNNSSIAYYSFKDATLKKNYFLEKNQRGLGDTANDLQLYGDKLYCIINVSNIIDVIDARTGLSIRQIPMVDENHIGRQPRYIDFLDGKAYICSFDGTVARLDTTTLEIEAFVKVGRNPDGICIANGKIYVSNSGGLDFPNYDNTVSVIDSKTFKEIKRIEVQKNPSRIHADSQGDIYVISRGNYTTIPYVLQKINSKTDELVTTFSDIKALNFTIHKDTAYVYNYDFDTKKSWIKVFDCISESIIKENFITDDTKINTPYGINVNPVNGDVYITEALDFTKQGSVFCFNNKGLFKFKLNQIGLNPNTVVFIEN